MTERSRKPALATLLGMVDAVLPSHHPLPPDEIVPGSSIVADLLGREQAELDDDTRARMEGLGLMEPENES